MDVVIKCLSLLGLIIRTARQAEIPPELVLAIIEAESGGNPYETVYDQNYPWVNRQAKRPARCSQNTETVHQKTAWGLMRLMGYVARQMGFDGWLSELVDPAANIETGVKYLAHLKEQHHEKHGLDGVIAAYSYGAPRRDINGKFRNQHYVDAVKSHMERYAEIIAANEGEAIAALEKTFAPGDEPVDLSGSQAAGAVLPDEDDTQKTAEGACEPMTHVAGNELTGEKSIGELTRAELIEKAKSLDIAVTSRMRTETIVARIEEALKGQESPS